MRQQLENRKTKDEGWKFLGLPLPSPGDCEPSDGWVTEFSDFDLAPTSIGKGSIKILSLPVTVR